MRQYGRPRVDDPDRLARVTALGVDETAFLAANSTHHPVFVTGVVDLARPRLLDASSDAAAGLCPGVSAGQGDRSYTADALSAASPPNRRSSMSRLSRVAISVPLALAATGLTAAPAFAHGNYHNVEVSGSMYLVDDESWGSDETGWHSFTGAATVGNWITQNSYSTNHCVGGEVRGDLRVTVDDSAQYPGWVLATVDAKLYEGTSCSTGDLDGHRRYSRWVAAGGSENFTFRVNNTDEGGDYIDFNFNVRNHTH